MDINTRYINFVLDEYARAVRSKADDVAEYAIHEADGDYNRAREVLNYMQLEHALNTTENMALFSKARSLLLFKQLERDKDSV